MVHSFKNLYFNYLLLKQKVSPITLLKIFGDTSYRQVNRTCETFLHLNINCAMGELGEQFTAINKTKIPKIAKGHQL